MTPRGRRIFSQGGGTPAKRPSPESPRRHCIFLAFDFLSSFWLILSRAEGLVSSHEKKQSLRNVVIWSQSDIRSESAFSDITLNSGATSFLSVVVAPLGLSTKLKTPDELVCIILSVAGAVAGKVKV